MWMYIFLAMFLISLVAFFIVAVSVYHEKRREILLPAIVLIAVFCVGGSIGSLLGTSGGYIWGFEARDNQYEEPYINEYWIEERRKLSGWESWDHGNKVTYHNDTNVLEMEFWSDGLVIITMTNATEKNGDFNGYKIDNNTWYSLFAREGTSYYMLLEKENNNCSIVVTLYREKDPYYFYEYKPVSWNFEVKT